MFGHGVASGDLSDTSVVLWTRVDDDRSDMDDVRWEVRDERGAIVQEGRTRVDRRADATARVVITGLLPDRRYTYAFCCDGVRSSTGRFKTLPAEAEHVRIAVVTCAKYNAGFFNVYRRLAERDDLDFVIHLGDYIYEAAERPPASQTPGAGIGRGFEPAHECRTLADYRERYALYRRDPDVQALHAAHAVMATIDDHELADNAWEGGAQEHRDERDGPWPTRVGSALRAWHEWMPTALRPADGDAIWRDIDLAPLARIAMLETRLERGRPDPDDDARSLFGDRQRRWLHDLLRDSGDVAWTMLGMPSMLAPIWSTELDGDAAFALKRLKLVDPETGEQFHDLGDSFPHERDALLEAISAAPSDTVIASGDLHVAIDAEVQWHGGVVAHEWVAPSVTSQNLDDKMGWDPGTRSRTYEERFLAGAPHVSWCDFDSHGFLIVDLTLDEARCEWWAVDTVLRRSTGQKKIHEHTVRSRRSLEGPQTPA
ncbi:MAG TPA: alkaline phosphatase D family protein [Solirubrobacteraceae bacterium]|nr:alkaline phosphatase D family protein [Solirubrobacteraceae bacterium]